ncbi:MAG: FtsW/RodA/SpoVE family cell cycle protein [Gaiella sp.]
MRARLREPAALALLLAGAAVGTAAFATVWMESARDLDTGWVPWAVLVVGAYLVVHLVVRVALRGTDPVLLPVSGLLTALGLTFIYRVAPENAERQLAWLGIGLAALLAVVLVVRDHRRLERYPYLFGLAAIGLLLLPSVPGLGLRVNEVRLWIELGPFRLQPGELAKLCLVVFLAAYLRDKREALTAGRLKDVGPLLVVWGAALLVIVQTSDLGSALLNFGIFLAMLYVATGRPAYVIGGLALFGAGAYGLYHAIDRVQQRVTVWLHPWTDEPVFCAVNGKLELRQDCASYQLVKSLYSVGNGGPTGTGLGRGTFETLDGAQLIPYLDTDFIYSAIGQELGFVGAAAVVLLYVVLVVRGMRIAREAPDGFSKLLAAGLAFGLALQTFIIVGGVVRVLPLTGITLPFVSYGGSSILANMIAVGLLLLVAHRGSSREGAS